MVSDSIGTLRGFRDSSIVHGDDVTDGVERVAGVVVERLGESVMADAAFPIPAGRVASCHGFSIGHPSTPASWSIRGHGRHPEFNRPVKPYDSDNFRWAIKTKGHSV